MNGRSRGRGRAVAIAAAVSLWLASAARTGAATPPDSPLTRPEFDKEISLHLEAQDVGATLSSIGRLVGVRFLIAFDTDPAIRVNLAAENMVSRGILESLANSYELEYSASGRDVVVRRRSVAAAGGPRAARAPATYWYEIAARNRGSGGEAFPRLERQPASGRPLVFSVTGRPDTTIPVVHPRLGTLDPTNVGAFQLALTVKADTGSSLELVAELVTHRNLGERRYAAVHSITTATAADSELVLFRTEEGMEIVLTAWGRSAVRASTGNP